MYPILKISNGVSSHRERTIASRIREIWRRLSIAPCINLAEYWGGTRCERATDDVNSSRHFPNTSAFNALHADYLNSPPSGTPWQAKPPLPVPACECSARCGSQPGLTDRLALLYAVSLGLESVPEDVLYCIAQCVQARSGLHSFSMTSRTIRSVCVPLLFARSHILCNPAAKEKHPPEWILPYVK